MVSFYSEGDFKLNMFKLLLGLVALSVAACAAFFSVQGVASLYSDQFMAVCIMAGSLEIGKLVAATYLHRYWSAAGLLLKSYLTLAVAILMAITSLGIFGFLTSAYQKNFAQVELVDSKQNVFQSRNEFLETQIKSLNDRIAVLNEARSAQEKRLPSLSRLSAKPIYEDIERTGKEIALAREKIDEMSKQLLTSTEEVIDLKTKKTEHHDIGTLQFVAKALNVEVDKVVNWFTLVIVSVFDPLALCLILAYSSLTKKRILVNESDSQTESNLNISESNKQPTIEKKSTNRDILETNSLIMQGSISKNDSEIEPQTFLDEMQLVKQKPLDSNAKKTEPTQYAYEDHLDDIAKEKNKTLSNSISKETSGKYRF